MDSGFYLIISILLYLICKDSMNHKEIIFNAITVRTIYKGSLIIVYN